MSVPTPTVLLAEPDEKLRAALRTALEKKGYRTATAVDGETAIAKFAEEPATVVVAAMEMPYRDGLELLRFIKESHPATEVILLAEADHVGSASIGLSDGAFTYLVKPIEDLRLVVHNVGLAAHFQHLLQRSSPAREAMIQTTAVEMIDHLLARVTDERLLQASLSEKTPVPAPRPRESREATLDSTAAHVLRQILQIARGEKALAQVFEYLMQASVNLFDAPHAAVLLMSPASGLELYNAHGYADKQAAGRNLLQAVGEEFAWRVAQERKTIVETKKGTAYLGAPLIARDELLGVLVVYPLKTRAPDPKRLEWLGAFSAQCALAMEIAKLQEEREKLLPTDSASGAFKRAAFLDLADREFRRCWRYDQPVSAMVIDLNGTRQVNNQRNRDLGDAVFRAVAGVCQQTVRQIDLVGKYDNDLFAVLLVMTGSEGARIVAERLSQAIADLRLPNGAEPARVTVKLGVSSYPREGCASIFDLLQSATGALKSARRAGTDQIFYA